MTNHFEIVVIGAGPAGMAAAGVAAKGGARTLVLDEQGAPGGQIYRAIEMTHPDSRPDFGASYAKGRPLTRQFRQSGVDYVPAAAVWLVSASGEIGYSHDGVSRLLKADQVIIATGAQERPIPVPGWTLPGVMTVGAAQILLKEAGVALENAIFAGTGPLLYAAVHQYQQAGIPIKAVLDLTPRKNYLRAVAHLPKVLPSVSKIAEGWLWKQKIAFSKVPYFQWVSEIKISGEHAATGVTYLHRNRWKQIDSQHVLLHLGVVPNINISRVAECETVWDETQLCWRVITDAWCRSSVPGIFVAGDGGGIVGAIAAEQQGVLAALEALRLLGRITTTQRNIRARTSRKLLKKELWARPFLDTLFRPASHLRLPQDGRTVVCRCEEITAAEIDKVVDLGCRGPNQVKSYSRCGMGPCQGRFCGLTVSELIARRLSRPVTEIGYYRLRPPLKPLLLSELATMQTEAEQEAGTV